MNNDEYRSTLLEISKRHGKKVPGAKYIHKWDMYMLEKQFCVDNMNFEGINSVLEIGCGMGMLAHLIREQKGITDIGRWSVLIGARAHKVSYFQEKKDLFKEKIKNFIKI